VEPFDSAQGKLYSRQLDDARCWILDAGCELRVYLIAESAELAEKKSVVGLWSVLPVAVGQEIVKMGR